MTYFDAPHAVTDKEKFEAMVEALRIGKNLPPIVVVGEQAICGSHRIAAVNAAWRKWANGEKGWENSPEPTLDSFDVTDVEIDFDELDYNIICKHVVTNTQDDNVKSALLDQI